MLNKPISALAIMVATITVAPHHGTGPSSRDHPTAVRLLACSLSLGEMDKGVEIETSCPTEVKRCQQTCIEQDTAETPLHTATLRQQRDAKSKHNNSLPLPHTAELFDVLLSFHAGCLSYVQYAAFSAVR